MGRRGEDAAIMSAEAMREFGHSRKAITILSRPLQRDFEAVRRYILELSKVADTWVATVPPVHLSR